MVTGLVSKEEFATRSSTGYFEFGPPGVNERLIREAGFELVRTEDVTENEVEVSRRWHDGAAAACRRVDPAGRRGDVRRAAAVPGHRPPPDAASGGCPASLYLGRKPGD